MLKVPFRQIYCENLGQVIPEMFWCFVVIKLYPNAHNLNEPIHLENGNDLCPYCNSEIVRHGEIKYGLE